MKRPHLFVAALSILGTLTLLAPGSSAQTQLHKFRPTPGGTYDQLGFAVAIDGNTAVIGAPKEDTAFADAGAAYVVDMTTWALLHKLVAPDGALGDSLGGSVAINGTYILVGADLDEDNGHDSGSAYLFDRSSGAFLFKLKPASGAADDSFGFSVALSGDRAIIGCPGDDDVAADSGAVFVFDATTGLELLKSKAIVPQNLGRFGYFVSADGNRMAIGAPSDPGTGSGRAFVFDIASGTQVVELNAPGVAIGDFFGVCVSIDSDRVLVGANRDNTVASDAGAAYLFNAGTGVQLFKFVAPDGGSLDRFGNSVALSGSNALIGSQRDDALADNAGSAYMFDGQTGSFEYKLTASDAASGDLFGIVATDGLRAVVGATGDDDQGESSGSAYVFSTGLAPGSAYCFGDGTAAACPCNAYAASGEGCLNTGSVGATLGATGVASIANDTFQLNVNGVPGTKPGLVLRGANQVFGGLGTPAGDGLLCATGTAARSHVQVTVGGSTTFTHFAGSGFGTMSYGAGQQANYQFWYRDPMNPCSGAGFNFTNGWTVIWTP